MEVQSQVNNVPSDLFLAKPAQAEIQWNSQGERIEVPIQSAISKAPQHESPHLAESSYEDVSLGDTPLAGPFDTLYPPTDDTGLVHAIVSCGHVLKSTHDLARWSEKTGARRVNGPESLDAVSDLIISLEAPKAQAQQQQQQGGEANLSFLFEDKKTGGSKSRSFNSSWRQKEPSKVISCGPVLKSTHDAATWSEKSGAHAVNSAASAGLLDEVAGNQSTQGNQGKLKRNNSGKRLSKSPSQVINVWPVLKSTHDSATWSEKKGVNSSESAGSLDDVAGNQSQGGKQAGGSSLQSGLDTQAGSHIQLDGSKGKETPEKAMEELHLHV